MTDYEYESYDWVEERISKLLREVDMLQDLKERFLELQRLKHPNPANAVMQDKEKELEKK